ncbi:hypothetical protein GF377_05465, partial [candidate division GN15 bacterium]|nr:hypothetical protein [candidate division GN15 bacterium]
MAKGLSIFNRTSDLYVGKSTLFKTFLIVGVMVISAFFIWYTLTLIDQLQEDTREQVEKYVGLWQLAANSPNLAEQSEVLQFIFDEIIVEATFPIIVVDPNAGPVSWRNIEGIPVDDTTEQSRQELTRVAEQMLEDNGEFPLYFGGSQVQYLRYGDSEVIRQLKVMPFIAVGLVFAFMTVGIIGFQNIRRSEERY